jgi:hypothetical protein
MENPDDRIQQVLQRIAQVWLVDDDRIQWVQPSERDAVGFDWWPGDFCVRVRAILPRETTALTLFKICIRTDFLKDVAIDVDSYEQVVSLAPGLSTSTYAWVYRAAPMSSWFAPSESSPGLCFSSTGYLTSGNIGWMPDFLANTGILQPIDAQTQALTMSEVLGSGKPDMTKPLALRDAGLDEVLEAITYMFAPVGQQPSRWAGSREFEEFVETWAGLEYWFGIGDPTGMMLETSFGVDTAIIQFFTHEKHPQLGHGLLVRLRLPPFNADCLSLARMAVELNLLEAITWTDFPQLGCWHINENRIGQEGLAFTLFVPNVLCKPVLVTNIAFWFLRRARWAREQCFCDTEDLTISEIFKRRQATVG